MRTGSTSLAAAALLTMLCAGTVLGQARPIEIGMDAALTYESRSDLDVELVDGLVGVDFPDVIAPLRE